MKHAAIIGGGPAGLMAAETLAHHGVKVTVFEAKPSVGRKFLMAGKSGLNLTKVEPPERFLAQFAEARSFLQDILRAMDAGAVQDWARSLWQETFVGSTGRVFPKVMKASPLLRAWLNRLQGMGVEIRTRTRWEGWQGGKLMFRPEGGEIELFPADVTVLAMGGASWSRLGSDGAWAPILAGQGIALSPFEPANAGVRIDWSHHMTPHFGTALKAIELTAGPYRSRGEAVISARGLEGGGVYAVSRGVREGHPLVIDLYPDLSPAALIEKIAKPRGKASLGNHLRKRIRMTPGLYALLQEFARPLPTEPDALANVLKALPIRHEGLRPLDEAISVAGGVQLSAMDQSLMLRAMPGVFVAGEMIDWEAPTGGYLITACLATGHWAGLNAVRYLS